MGGSAYGEFYGYARHLANDDATGWRTSAKVSLDARDNTEYGLLRTVVAPSWQSRVGASTGGSTTTLREGLTIASNNAGSAGTSLSTAGALRETQINVVAYVQLGGFTMGRLPSMAAPSFGPTSNIGYEGADNRYEMNAMAYTASMGNGISATVGIEDGTSGNRDGIYSVQGTHKNAAATYTVDAATGAYTAVAAVGGPVVNYGASQIPDAVAKFAIDQAWGSAYVSGILHQINKDTYLYTNSGTDLGYGVQGGAKINLPMLSAGDYLFANAVYASGFNQLVWANLTGDRNSQNTNSISVGKVGASLNDMVLDTGTGQTWNAKSYGVSGEFGHYFTPTLVGFVGASWAKIDWDGAARVAAGSATSAVINPTWLSRVNVGFQWQPVKGFKVQPEVSWLHISANAASNSVTGASATEGAAAKTDNAYIGRIRVTRDF